VQAILSTQHRFEIHRILSLCRQATRNCLEEMPRDLLRGILLNVQKILIGLFSRKRQGFSAKSEDALAKSFV